MTRIIAGIAKGRTLQVPKVGTRPTSDRVRESIFSMLQHDFGGDFSGIKALDLFSGTGAIALEALSRGAAHAVAVEANSDAVALIKQNAANSKLPLLCVKADVRKWVTKPNGEKFNFVFLDPPYEFDRDELQSIVDELVAGWLEPEAVILIERSSRNPGINSDAYECAAEERKFGDTTVQKLVW